MKLPNLPAYFGGFSPISQEPDFSRTCGFRQNVPTVILHDSKLFPEKTIDKISIEIRKTTKNGTFYHFFPNYGRTRFFLENRALLVFLYYCHLSFKKKNYEKLTSQSWDISRTDGRTHILSLELNLKLRTVAS